VRVREAIARLSSEAALLMRQGGQEERKQGMRRKGEGDVAQAELEAAVPAGSAGQGWRKEDGMRKRKWYGTGREGREAALSGCQPTPTAAPQRPSAPCQGADASARQPSTHLIWRWTASSRSPA
jgi:hypothetical protein